MALPRSAGAIGFALVILSSTTLAAPPPPDNQTDKQEAQRLANLPPLVERRAGQDHSGRKQKGVHPTTRTASPTGKQLTATASPQRQHRRQQDAAARHDGEGDQRPEREICDGKS